MLSYAVSAAALLLYLVLIAVSIACIAEVPVTKSLGLSVLPAVVGCYALALCGGLRFGPPVVYLLSLVLFGWTAFRKGKRLRETICNNAVVLGLFAAAFAVLTVLNAGRYAIYSDEFNHWAPAVKEMLYSGVLNSAAEAHLSHSNYPPALVLFEYFAGFPGRLVAGTPSPLFFREDILYLANQAAVVAFLFAVLPAKATRKPLWMLPVTAVLLLCTSVVFTTWTYRFLTVESFLGMIAGYTALWIRGRDSAPKAYRPALCLLLFTMVLAKNNGLVFCAALLLAAGLLEPKGKRVKLALKGGAACLAAWGSWQLAVRFGGGASKFAAPASLADKAQLFREVCG